MSINHNNIDQWLFDYYEGNLSPSQVKQLESFLKQNPEYYEDAEAWKDSFVEEAVPVFSTAALIKEADPMADRKKRLALVAILLLFISSSATLFLYEQTTNRSIALTKSTSTDKNYTSTSADKSTASFNKNTSLTGAKKVNWYENTVTEKISDNTGEEPAQNNQFITPAIHAPNANNAIVANTHQNSQLTNTNAANNNVVSSVSFVNGLGTFLSRNGHHALFVPSKLNAIQDNVKANDNGSNTIEQALANNNDQEAVNKIVREEKTNLTLTLENDDRRVEKNKKDPGVISELNPDELAKNKKEDESNKVVDVNPPKNKINHERSLRFNNLKNVYLLQNLNFEFENNASFAVQNYPTSGYLGARYNSTANGDYNSQFIAGYSQTLRKLKTTINAYGTYSMSEYVKNTGAVLQAAMNIKLDRHQSILPSIGFSLNQYAFVPQNDLRQTFAPDNSIYRDYFAYTTTGLKEYLNFKNATHFNANIGLVYHHKKFFTAFSMNGILQPKFKYAYDDRTYDIKNPARINLVAGTDFVSKKYPELSFSPQIGFEVRNIEASFTGGGIVRYKNWLAGASFSSTGSLGAYAGFTHKLVSLSYRFHYDKLEYPYGNILSHNVTASFNIKGFIRKQKAILDSEK